MAEAPTTRPSLLVRLRDRRDRPAWAQFVNLYAPLVYGFGRRQGLQDADAADLMQDVLRSVAGAVGRLDYDPRRGSFRGWLFTVARNRLRDFLDRSRRRERGSGDTSVQEFLDAQAAPGPDEEEVWEQEHRRQTLAWAAEQVRREVQEKTWQAFWQTAVEGKGGQEVARVLGMTVAAVYLAKSRVMARLRERVRHIESD